MMFQLSVVAWFSAACPSQTQMTLPCRMSKWFTMTSTNTWIAAIPASSARNAELSVALPGTYCVTVIRCVWLEVSIRAWNVAVPLSVNDPSLTAVTLPSVIDSDNASILLSSHSSFAKRYLFVSSRLLSAWLKSIGALGRGQVASPAPSLVQAL